jgi:hypothetical protein
MNIILYNKSETGWLGVFVCVLLGDGGLLLCSGGVSFLVSSRYFLWGPFRGGIFFGVRSEGIFACLLAVFQKRIMFGGAGPAESMAGETSQQRN